MQIWANKIRKKGKIVGLVPTMGYLHDGHLSLIKVAKRYSDITVVSIFVNPRQFGPGEDFDRYPRDFKRDKRLLKKLGVDIIFYPSVKEMYPESTLTFVEVPQLSKNLCGKSRPTHFRGVCTVVAKFFNIVKPHIAVFGQKDFQQATIIKKMVAGLDFDVKIIIGKTVREKDGLAMSSRNAYLTPRERKNAGVIYKSLKTAKRMFGAAVRDPKKIIRRMRTMILAQGGRIDYINIVDPKTLKNVIKVKFGDVVVLAVYFGKTRLIDNMTV